MAMYLSRIVGLTLLSSITNHMWYPWFPGLLGHLAFNWLPKISTPNQSLKVTTIANNLILFHFPTFPYHTSTDCRLSGSLSVEVWKVFASHCMWYQDKRACDHPASNLSEGNMTWWSTLQVLLSTCLVWPATISLAFACVDNYIESAGWNSRRQRLYVVVDIELSHPFPD